jgi:hypothetical protein
VSSDFRETSIRVSGVARVIRTERGRGTVAKMDAAHTKAVKAALEEMDRALVDAFHADAMAHLTTAEYPDPEGWGDMGVGAGERRRAAAIADEEARYAKSAAKRRFAFPRSNWVDARKGWPNVTFKPAIPPCLTEIEPGHWTDDPTGALA